MPPMKVQNATEADMQELEARASEDAKPPAYIPSKLSGDHGYSEKKGKS